MSKSFAIENGDLVLGSGRSLKVISGEEKLRQDLRLWILERIGTDPLTPTYGSTLDGGLIDGTPVDSFVGQIVTEDALSQINMVVQQLIERYQIMQLTKMQEEVLIYNGQHTLDPEEVVDHIERVNSQVIGTTILVQAVLKTFGGTTVTLTLPVGETTV